MKFHLDCAPCLLRQALQASRFVTSNSDLHKEILAEVLSIIQNNLYKESVTTSEMSQLVQAIIRKKTNNKDPYYSVKKEYNSLALSLVPKLNQIISSASDPLYTSIKLAIAGNIIDFGAKERFNVEDTIKEVLHTPLAIDSYPIFKEKMSSSASIALLVDNTGEIVFDKLFLFQLLEHFPELKRITVFVKGSPTLNDAMLEDVLEVGFNDIPKVDFAEVDISLTVNPSIRSDFLNQLQQYDLVISKGQGNFEEFMDQPFFFLLMVKCNLVANQLQVNVDQPVFIENLLKKS